MKFFMKVLKRYSKKSKMKGGNEDKNGVEVVERVAVKNDVKTCFGVDSHHFCCPR